ncbi:hypothetical protein EVAR_15118_1 [Eumeta japonica]|uniref:HTH psq-type domain-containing protein n=1 Tax=Eumeta variegata TaxID=151549 RepID=A0A4C1UI54_EUMVA|nr:hypothetical protein EVAR_15118_1 [Eumeta japonica]
MVKNYKRTTNRGDWSEEVMRNAVDSVVQGKMGYYLAAKTFGVPQTTLERKVKMLCESSKENASVRPQIGVPVASGANAQLTPGSGPQCTPRRGAAGSDANSPRLPHSPRARASAKNLRQSCRRGRAQRPGDKRRPSCVRVCYRTRAPRFALRPGPACTFCDYPQFIEIPD